MATTRARRTFSIGRRSFLSGLGSAAGAAVFLRPLIAEAEGTVPQRFLYLHYPCGTVIDVHTGWAGAGPPNWYWFPSSGTGRNYDASPILKLFEPVRDSILVVDGVNIGDVGETIDGDKEAQPLMYMGTGWLPVAVDGMPIASQFDPPNAKYITVPKGTKTIDQLLLDKVPALTAPLAPGGMGPQYRSIQLCGTAKSMPGMGFASLKVLSYAGNDQPLWGEGRSQSAFNNIFGSAMMPGVDPAVFARHQAQKKSVLDSVMTDIQRMQALVPVSQRPKLDAQLTAIRALEARISSEQPPPGSIVKPTLIPEPTVGANGADADEARHEALITNMLEIVRCAFASDLTRVASITYADVNNPLRPIAFIPNPGFTNNGDGHGVAHSGKSADALEAKGEVSAFYSRLTAAALAKMSQTPEGSGTLLDNTFGMFFSEVSDGDNMSRLRIPFLLFGGKFLKLDTGRFVAVQPSAYVNDVWAAVLTAWGVPTTVYGDPMYGRGPLPGLFAP